MKKILVAILCGVLPLLGLLTAHAADTLPKPDALSEETILLTERLSKNYDTLIIKDFTANGTEYSSVDSEERVKIDAMMPLLRSNIASTLESELKAKYIFKTITTKSASSGRVVVLEGNFSEFNAGSKALKFFVGFGAGKAYIKFKGRLLDGATGKELALFEDRETGYRGSMSMEGFEALFPHQAKGIGENLAKFIEKLY